MKDDLDRVIVKIIVILVIAIGFISIGLSGKFDHNDCIEKYGNYQCIE